MTTFVLAGGCFWCLDAVFRRVRGVEVSLCGYTGGAADDAYYEAVSTGETGHAEAVRVVFDEAVIPPEVLLDIYFLIHDPTTKNRQGADVGPQYRSALFYENDAQKSLFEAAGVRAAEHFKNPIVTEIAPLKAFYEAEPEHQNYFTRSPEAGYCQVVIAPKVNKARQKYAAWLKG